jgi:hypothetical protein
MRESPAGSPVGADGSDESGGRAQPGDVAGRRRRGAHGHVAHRSSRRRHVVRGQQPSGRGRRERTGRLPRRHRGLQTATPSSVAVQGYPARPPPDPNLHRPPDRASAPASPWSPDRHSLVRRCPGVPRQASSRSPARRPPPSGPGVRPGVTVVSRPPLPRPSPSSGTPCGLIGDRPMRESPARSPVGADGSDESGGRAQPGDVAGRRRRGAHGHVAHRSSRRRHVVRGQQPSGRGRRERIGRLPRRHRDLQTAAPSSVASPEWMSPRSRRLTLRQGHDIS